MSEYLTIPRLLETPPGHELIASTPGTAAHDYYISKRLKLVDMVSDPRLLGGIRRRPAGRPSGVLVVFRDGTAVVVLDDIKLASIPARDVLMPQGHNPRS